MRAMVLESPRLASEGPLVPKTLSPGEPGAGMLAVRVAACGVCRTDLQLCEGDLPIHKLPVIPGHQAVGRVESIGSNVSGWAIGERVAVALRGSTGGVVRVF